MWNRTYIDKQFTKYNQEVGNRELRLLIPIAIQFIFFRVAEVVAKLPSSRQTDSVNTQLRNLPSKTVTSITFSVRKDLKRYKKVRNIAREHCGPVTLLRINPVPKSWSPTCSKMLAWPQLFKGWITLSTG